MKTGALPAPQPRRKTTPLLPPVTKTDLNVIGLVLLTKLLTLLFGVFAYDVASNQRIGTLRNALEIWNRWDAPHYLDIAVHGYQRVGDPKFFIVFFPLFPWLVRVAVFFTRDPLLSAFIVSGVATLVIGVALARLVALNYPEPVAYRAVYFMFIFPSAYFLHIGYTESLFLALVISSFLAARRERWFSAAMLGALASLTRMNGLFLIPALVVEAFHQMWAERRWRWGWLWLAIVPLGFGVYLLVNYWVTGNPLTFSEYERSHWSQSLTLPWKGMRQMGREFWLRSPRDAQMIGLQIVLYLAIGFLATVASLLMLRPCYIVWMAANWVLTAGLTWDLSSPRYLLGLFPMFIVFARLARNRECNAIITFWSLASMGVFISQFVRDLWAF